MNLILFGFKACGKTYLGKKLAEKMHLPFFDTDQLIEKRYQELKGEHLSCREMSLKYGEAFFRELEKEVIRKLDKVEKAVISLGGGSVLNPENVSFLAKIGTLVYLQVERERIRERLMKGPLPSYLDPQNPEGSFTKMYEERKEIYEHIPAVWIDANLDEQEIIKELVTLLR